MLLSEMARNASRKMDLMMAEDRCSVPSEFQALIGELELLFPTCTECGVDVVEVNGVCESCRAIENGYE